MMAITLRASRHGFALVDVLVALAITALAGAVLVGLLGFTQRSLQTSRELTRSIERIAAISRLLQTLTEEAYSVRAPGRGISLPHGTAREFSITTTGPRVLDLPQPVSFTLRSETVGENSRMVLQWIDPATGQEHREAIGERLEHAEFSYFGRHDGSAEHSWYPAWANGSGHLEALKLTIKSSAAFAPIDLIVPLRGDLAVQCVRNPYQPGCTLNEQ